MNVIKIYYSVILFIAFFIFIPFNNTLLNIYEIGLPTVGSVIPLILVGIGLMFLDFKNFSNFLLFKVPLSLLFFLISSMMIISQSYILDTASYVPKEYLNTLNIFWFIYLIAGFILAYYLEYWIYFFRTSKYTIYIASSLAFGVFSLLFLEFNLNQIISRSVFEIVHINYQMVADMFVISSALLMAKDVNSKTYYIIIIFLSILLLIVLGSRSATIFYMFSLILFGLRNLKFKQIVTISLIIIFTYLLFYSALLNYFSNDSRTLDFLTGNYENSKSIIERNNMLNINLINIYEVWFTGNIYGEFSTFNRQGTYIHNYFAYLQNFGFIPFIILNILFFRTAYLLMIHSDNSFKYKFIFLIFFFTIFSMLIARSYTSMYFIIILIISEAFVNSLKNDKFSNNK